MNKGFYLPPRFTMLETANNAGEVLGLPGIDGRAAEFAAGILAAAGISIGIFSIGGEGYFKKFGGDRLISLNPAYKDIRLDEHTDITCFGKVIGKLKK